MDIIIDVKQGIELIKKINPEDLNKIQVYGLLEDNSIEKIEIAELINQ